MMVIMAQTQSDEVRHCPQCGEEVDPLRARAVSVVDGRITHFCSAECREKLLRPKQAVPQRAPDTAETPPAAATEEQPLPDQQQDAATVTAGPRFQHPSAFKLTGSRLFKRQLIQLGCFAGVSATAMLIPPLWGGWLPMAIVGLEALALLVLMYIEQGPGNLAVRLAGAAAVPVAATALLLSTWFSHETAIGVVAAAGLLVAERFFRLLELLGRFRSGVLATVEGVEQSTLSSSWRDNSAMAAVLRRVSLVLEWARYLGAIAIAAAILFWQLGTLSQALLGASMVLLILSPRTLRMVTGDAHLSMAIASTHRDVIIRDAHVVDRLANVRAVVFMQKRVLVAETVTVVDWVTVDGADENKILAALKVVQAKVDGPIARGFAEFVRRRELIPLQANEVTVHQGQGVSGATDAGLIRCGSRRLLLENGISTAVLEPQAGQTERTGRRAIFVALDDELVAVFGVEEQPIEGAKEMVQALSRRGLEPVLLTSAEVDAATTLGNRLGIENVRFETAEADLGQVLRQISDCGDNALLIGHGPAFEEHVRSAAAALAIGGAEPSQAGVDARQNRLNVVPWIVKSAQGAQRSARVNLIAVCTLVLVGVALALSWLSPWVAITVGCSSFLIAASSTLNGPYHLLENVGYWGKSVGRRLKKQLKR